MTWGQLISKTPPVNATWRRQGTNFICFYSMLMFLTTHILIRAVRVLMLYDISWKQIMKILTDSHHLNKNKPLAYYVLYHIKWCFPLIKKSLNQDSLATPSLRILIPHHGQQHFTWRQTKRKRMWETTGLRLLLFKPAARHAILPTHCSGCLWKHVVCLQEGCWH